MINADTHTRNGGQSVSWVDESLPISVSVVILTQVRQISDKRARLSLYRSHSLYRYLCLWMCSAIRVVPQIQMISIWSSCGWRGIEALMLLVK